MNNTDKKMTIIITMAGLGSRFKDAGYKLPKYMIEAKGRTLFEWSMDSLSDYNLHVSKYIFVVKKEDKAKKFIEKCCKKCGIESMELVEIDQVTDGQATTCMLAIPYCNFQDPIMIYNIDTYVECGGMRYRDITGSGHIPCFHAEGKHWSFVRANNEGKVVEVKEKERISGNCSLGAYYFSSGALYKTLYNEYYNSSKRNGEKYIAPLYNLMIKKGMEVTMSIVDKSKVHVLGTPEELEVFLREDKVSVV